MLKTKLSVDRKTFKKTKKKQNLGRPYYAKKLQKTTKQNKHNIAGYVFFNFFAMITTSIPQTFIAQ